MNATAIPAVARRAPADKMPRQQMPQARPRFFAKAIPSPGSHHLSRAAERNARAAMSTSRARLLHLALRWSDMPGAQLWPMGVRHAAWLWSHLANASTGASPQGAWPRARLPLRKLHGARAWGCPAHALEKRIAGGKKLLSTRQQCIPGAELLWHSNASADPSSAITHPRLPSLGILLAAGHHRGRSRHALGRHIL